MITMRPLVPLLIALTAGACATSSGEGSARTEAPIIEGNLEPTRYPAMGYLVHRINTGPHAGEIFRPNCGATLIAKRVVVTAGHCVEDKTSTVSTIVAVGFGDGHTGRTYGVAGTWEAWVHPRFLRDMPFGPDGELFPVYDTRYDVAVIGLTEDVEEIEPMALWEGAIPVGTPGLVIGYGRVAPGVDDERDSFENRPDHRDRYPGIRKSFDVEVVQARQSVEIRPLPLPGRNNGGTSHGDSGSALILDGKLAGVVVTRSKVGSETPTGDVDAGPGFQAGYGTRFARLGYSDTPDFIAQRVATITGSR